MATARVKSSDGTVYEIPESEYARAIRSGKYAPIDEKESAEVDRQRELESPGAKVATAVQGALTGAWDVVTSPVRGALAGASALGVKSVDPLLEGMGGREVLSQLQGVSERATGATAEEAAAAVEAKSQQQRELAAANPYSAMGGSIAGQVAAFGVPGLLRGGAAAAAAPAAARGLGATVSRAALRTGAEGALIGGTIAQDQAWLEKRRLTGEQYVAAMGLTGVLSAGLGAGGALLSRAFGAVTRRGASEISGEVSVPASESSAVSKVELHHKGVLPKFASASDADLEHLIATQTARDVEPGAVAALRELEHGKLPAQIADVTHEAQAKVIASDLDDAMAISQKLERRIDNKVWKRAEVATNLQKAGVNEAEALNAARAQAKYLRDTLAEPVESTAPKSAMRLYNAYQKRITQLSGKIEGTSSAADAYIALDEVRRTALRTSSAFNRAAVRTADPEIAVYSKEIADRIGTQYDATWQHLMNESVWGEQGAAQKAVNNARVVLIQQEQRAMPALAQQIGTEYERMGVTSPVYRANSASIWNLVKSAGSFQNSSAESATHRYFNAIAGFSEAMQKYGLSAEDIAAAKEAGAAANRLTATLNEASQTAKAVAQAQQVFEKARVQSTIFGSGMVGSIATAISNPAKLMSVRLHVEHTAESAVKNVQSAISYWLGGTAGAIGKAIAAPASTVGRALRYGGAHGLFMGGAKSSEVAYEKRKREIFAATDDGGATIREGLADRLGEAADGDPALLTGAVASATAGALFLRSKFDVPNASPDSLLPRTDAPKPTAFDIAKVSRYWETVNRPIDVLRRELPRHGLTSEHVEALRAVYPGLFSWVQREVVAQLREQDKKGHRLSLRARAQADLLLGLDGAGDRVFSASFGARWGAKMGDETPSPLPARHAAIKGPSMPSTTTDRMLGNSAKV